MAAALSLITLRIAAAVTAVAATAVAVQLAARERTPPVRCPAGLTLDGGRCCGWKQTWNGTRCAGPAQACGPGQELVEGEGETPSCVLPPRRIKVAGGRLPPGSADWHVTDPTRPILVPGFAIDRAEVTVSRYLACVARGLCPELPAARDPGVPVTGVSPRVAERFCRFAGGRLPTSGEWRLAAAGTEGRRFPWGSTGLVCRRAAFGLLNGPCSTAGTGPELAGARPPGATPEGVLDLSGNVAEWTLDPNGGYRARGGSYRSRVAAELLTAAVEAAPENAEHVGFRCVY